MFLYPNSWYFYSLDCFLSSLLWKLTVFSKTDEDVSGDGQRLQSSFSKPFHSGLEVDWGLVIFSTIAAWNSVSKCELCFQQQNDKDVVLSNEERQFLFYKTSFSASVVLFMNNTLCICIMRQCLIEWLHNMFFHRIKYEIFIRPERELECLVVKSLTREIQLLFLASSDYVSSLYNKALKVTRNFTLKNPIPS